MPYNPWCHAENAGSLIVPQTVPVISMTDKPAASGRITPAGLMFLAITSLGWGFNWPVTKHLVGVLPPLTLRGTTGVVGAALLALLAVIRSQSLAVPREVWPRLILAGMLNVTAWMVLMGLALLWLPASEAALIAYTMPVWASLLAWPILGERPTALRVLALVLAFAGLASIMGSNGLNASRDKLPGILMVLGGAFGFALGTVMAKKLPIKLPPLSAAAWQIGIGCVPIVLVGLALEQSDWTRLDQLDWALMFYSTVIQFCVAYVAWFAALARLPASVAAIGTMAVPVIGVVASAIALREPLGAGQIAALAFTLGAVALATRG
ncbi:putative transport protein; putative permease of the drug/metabolite transporter (DMT) superfamily [Bradyrhizobium sp. ORS 278]|nr:putative transport protein; putative permease of the drug/metabolite transporter (DMT) superfamily [Bradyrhizobium sp. ORS 278]